MAVIFVAAFALFALFAWMAITDSERKAEFYRGRYEECLEELAYRRECQASDSETISRMWEELDRRRMEAKHAEYLLQDAFEGHDAPEEEIPEYRPMSALETEAFMTTSEDLFGDKIMRAADEAVRLMGCSGLYYSGELPDEEPEGAYYAILEDGALVAGEYPKNTEALVVANGADAKHYQLLMYHHDRSAGRAAGTGRRRVAVQRDLPLRSSPSRSTAYGRPPDHA